MHKKLSLQISIIFFIIIFSIFFFNKIFFKKDIDIVKIEKVSVPDEKNLIKGIKYFSKDLKGNTYLIEAESGVTDQINKDIIYLKDVKAKINFDENKLITISSLRAIYNIRYTIFYLLKISKLLFKWKFSFYKFDMIKWKLI